MRLLTSAPQDIERAIREPADNPRGLLPLASTVLPDPSKFPWSVIVVTDLKTLALSDGINWYPLEVGAAL